MTTLVKAKAKVATVVPKQAPEFVREEHQQFIKFLQAYYEWLELQGNAGYVLRELEDTFDIDKTVDDFVDYFKKELLIDIPVNALSDKRYLAKQINDLYRTKGTRQSYELLFRILFNEEAEIYYPKVDVLRASDGKYDRHTVIKVIETQGDAFNLVGQTIHQDNPVASARVESIIKYSAGAYVIAEITINKQTIVGNFNTAVEIYGLDNTDGSTIRMITQTMITDVRIDERGSYYQIGDKFTTDAGSGQSFLCEVSTVKSGAVKGIAVIQPGSGYQLGQEIIVNNNNTNGGGLHAIIEEIDRDAIILEGVTSALYSSTTLTYDLGDPTPTTADVQLGRLSDTTIVGGKVEYLLLEDGSKIIPEGSQQSGIKKVKIIDGGNGYNKLPIVTAPSIPGTGAVLAAYGEDIGRITGINITDLGIFYEAKPSVASPVNAIIKYTNNAVFAQGEAIYSETEVIVLENGEDRLLLENDYQMVLEEQKNGFGYYSSFDTPRNLLKISPANTMIRLKVEDDSGYLMFENGKVIATENSGEFTVNQNIRGLISGARARIVSVGHAEVTPIRGAVGSYVGQFIGADGKLSEASKKMQDNLYYQDFSYVVKVGQSIDKYRDAVKKLLHPVGLALFGEVRVQSVGDGRMPSTFKDASLTRFLSFLLLILQAKMRGISREIKLVYPMFFNQNMRLHVLKSELLPTILLPHDQAYLYLLDLRAETIMDWWTKIDLNSALAKSILAQNVVTIETKVLKENVKVVGGPTLGDLEKWKFFFPPYEGGTKNSLNLNRDVWSQSYPDPNGGYWGGEAGNTQIKDFANIALSEVINNPEKKCNFNYNEAYVDIFRFPAETITFDSGTTYITMDRDGFDMSTDTERLDATDIYFDDNVTTIDSTQ